MTTTLEDSAIPENRDTHNDSIKEPNHADMPSSPKKEQSRDLLDTTMQPVENSFVINDYEMDIQQSQSDFGLIRGGFAAEVQNLSTFDKIVEEEQIEGSENLKSEMIIVEKAIESAEDIESVETEEESEARFIQKHLGAISNAFTKWSQRIISYKKENAKLKKRIKKENSEGRVVAVESQQERPDMATAAVWKSKAISSQRALQAISLVLPYLTRNESFPDRLTAQSVEESNVHEERNRQLDSQLLEAANKFDMLQTLNQSMAYEYEQLKQEFNAVSAEKNAIVEKVESEMQELESHISRADEELAKHNDLVAENIALKSEIDALRATKVNETASPDLEELTRNLAQALNEKENYRRIIETLTLKNELQENDLERLNGELSALKDRIQANTQPTDELASLKQEKEFLLSKCNDHESEIQSLRNDLSEKQQLVDSLNSDLLEARKTFEEDVNALRATLEASEKKAIEAQALICVSQTKENQLNTALKELKMMFDKKLSVISEMKTHQEIVDKEKGNLLQHILRLEEECRLAASATDAKAAQVAEMNERLLALEKDGQGLKKAMTELERRRNEAEDRCERVQDQLQREIERSDEFAQRTKILETDLAIAEKKSVALLAERDTLIVEISNLKEANEALRVENSSLRNQCEEQNAKTTHAEREIKEKNQQIYKLEIDIGKLQEMNQQISEELEHTKQKASLTDKRRASMTMEINGTPRNIIPITGKRSNVGDLDESNDYASQMSAKKSRLPRKEDSMDMPHLPITSVKGSISESPFLNHDSQTSVQSSQGSTDYFARRSSRSSHSAKYVVSFSGFRDDLAQYSTTIKNDLVTKLKSLGGIVKLDGEFEGSISHVIVPPGCRTLKTFAAVLTGKWLITDVNWVLDSHREGKFLPEEKYGKRYYGEPFKDMRLFIADSFINESKNGKEFRVENAKNLVGVLGRGRIVKTIADANTILRSASDKLSYPADKKSISWVELLDMIPIDGTESSNK